MLSYTFSSSISFITATAKQTLICCRPPNLAYKNESMGKSVPGIEVQIVDDDGNIVDRGTEGNIGVLCKPVRPIGLFTGYVVRIFSGFFFSSVIYNIYIYIYIYTIRQFILHHL